MGVGTSILLIAIGAILKFAVTATVSGISVATVGVILMVVGIIGLLISLLWDGVFASRRHVAVTERPVVVEPPVVRDRDVY